jgi:pimeloyl-ACP methyl ester carboxylesterase
VTTIQVPDARLYYEIQGSGPLMIMIPGSAGAAEPFRLVAEQLAPRYTVVAYDRRGFSRSELDGPQDWDHRIETDADDVRRLIEHLSEQPAVIVGVSSGAIVALEVLVHHPTVVRTLVPFEPPAVMELADGQRWVDFFHEVYDVYCQSGIEPAMTRFVERAFAEVDRQVIAHAPQNRFSRSNAVHWFEHELRQYPAIRLDRTALGTRSDRIILAAGRESRGYPCHQTTLVLAERLGRDMVELPGGHLAFISSPAEFVRALESHLAGK